MFRWLTLAILLGAVSVSGYHRWRARQHGEVIPRAREGAVLVALRGAVTLPLVLTILAHLAAPAFMAWATFPAPTWLRWSGAALGLACIAAVSWVLRSLGRNVSETVFTKAHHELVVDGPYHWVRHPLYLTGLALIAAMGLMLSSWLVLALGGLVLVLIRFVVIPREEEALLDKFGDTYREYLQGTGRLLARLVKGDTPMRPMIVAAVLAESLLLFACDEGDSGMYGGVYLWGFETSSFRVCGSNEFWWASGELRRLVEVTPAPGASGVFAVISGEVSPPGSYGHLGQYPREITVRKVPRVLAGADPLCP
jgi:protein-S-isoprenylcysteine O-methyltransferase Ste14